MEIFNWLKRKSSSVSRALSMVMPLQAGLPFRADYASAAREGYAKNTVVFACVREIAEAAAGVEWILYERQSGGTRSEVEQHPLLDLLDRPNPLQGRFEFMETVLAFLYLAGNAFVESVAPENRPPRELYVLRPDRVKVLPDPVHLVGGYEYSVAGKTVRFPAGRILHLKLFHPLDDWYGLSPVQVAAAAVDKMNLGDRWNAALLQNMAVPSGALVSRHRLTDEQFRRLREEMRHQLQGVQNAREPLLLEQDLEWKELGLSPKDMDWTEGIKFSALQIAQAYNVPPELIGLNSATYQNRREARKALYTEVVCPALNRLRDALNQWLAPQFGPGLFLDYDKDGIEALAEDQESLWRRAESSGFLTLNEKRRLLGYADLPGGDVLGEGNSPK